MIIDQHQFHLSMPVEEVYAFIIVAENMLSLLPNDPALTYSGVETKPDGGYRYEVIYNLFRMKIVTISETVELIPNEKLVIESEGQINGQTIWTLTPDENGTRVTISYEYDEPDNTLRAITSLYANVVIRSTLFEIANNAQSRIKPRGAA